VAYYHKNRATDRISDT